MRAWDSAGRPTLKLPSEPQRRGRQLCNKPQSPLEVPEAGPRARGRSFDGAPKRRELLPLKTFQGEKRPGGTTDAPRPSSSDMDLRARVGRGAAPQVGEGAGGRAPLRARTHDARACGQVGPAALNEECAPAVCSASWPPVPLRTPAAYPKHMRASGTCILQRSLARMADVFGPWQTPSSRNSYNSTLTISRSHNLANRPIVTR